MNDKLITVKELKQAIWKYVGKHGTLISNGNLDYVIEQALKEQDNER